MRMFCNFCTGVPHSSRFKKVQELLKNSFFYPRSEGFVISSREHSILAIFSKVNEFVENNVFSPRWEGFVISLLGHNILAVFSKVNEFVENSVLYVHVVCIK